jgi:hypothetical protein
MSVDIQRRVEALTAQAERLDAEGGHEEARHLYLEAAEQEAIVFDGIPLSRPRTRGIIAVSVVSLFWRAGALDEVVRKAQEYLATPELPGFARAQIAELLAGRDPAHPSVPTRASSPGSTQISRHEEVLRQRRTS